MHSNQELGCIPFYDQCEGITDHKYLVQSNISNQLL